MYYPRQTVVVSVRAEAHIMGKEIVKDNLITLSWHMPVSFEPELYAIAVGKTRFSCKLIRKAGAFAVNFMPRELEKEAVMIGSVSGHSVDKFEETKLTREECSTIDCPRIKEASAYLECELVNEYEAGDHVIFIGKVVSEHEKDQRKRLVHLGKDKFTTSVD